MFLGLSKDTHRSRDVERPYKGPVVERCKAASVFARTMSAKHLYPYRTKQKFHIHDSKS